MAVPQPNIIQTTQWGARSPRQRPVMVGRPEEIVIHHTFGRGPRTGEAVRDGIRYARGIQDFHMGPERGWNDSGHNFLIMRSGIILVGRRMSLVAIRGGRMVQSAHCPGKNDQPGIELEHYMETDIPSSQWVSLVRLCSWIMSRTRMRPTNIFWHSLYYPTTCPDIYRPRIPQLRADVARYLNSHGRGPAKRLNGLGVTTRNLPGIRNLERMVD